MDRDSSYQFDYVPLGNDTLELLASQDEVKPPDPTGADARSPFQDEEGAVVVGSHNVALDEIVLIELQPRRPSSIRGNPIASVEVASCPVLS